MPSSVSVQMLPEFLQCALTQEIGIALAGIGNCDDAPGDDFVGNALVWKPKGCASHFECGTMTPLVSGSNFWSPRNGVIGMDPGPGLNGWKKPSSGSSTNLIANSWMQMRHNPRTATQSLQRKWFGDRLLHRRGSDKADGA